MERQLEKILNTIVELDKKVKDMKWEIGTIKCNQDRIQRKLEFLEKMESSHTDYIVDIFEIYYSSRK